MNKIPLRSKRWEKMMLLNISHGQEVQETGKDKGYKVEAITENIKENKFMIYIRKKRSNNKLLFS